MRTFQKFGVARFVPSTREVLVAFDAVEEAEVALRSDVVAHLCSETDGVIWPSVVVTRKHYEDGTRISVRGLAYRAMAGGSNAQQV